MANSNLGFTDSSNGQFSRMLKEDQAAKAALAGQHKSEFSADCYTKDELTALNDPEVKSMVLEAFGKRRELQISGGKLSDYIRSSLTDGPFGQLPPNLEAALRKLDARYPAPSNPLLA